MRLALCLIPFAAQGPAHPFESEIAQFEAADRQNPPAPGGIVFVGSSSIRLWKTLNDDFPQYQTLNRGFGGSQISDSVFFANRIVTPYKPKVVVFFAGTNDINDGKSPETVLQDYQRFVDVVRSECPTTPIVYLSISPAPSRWAKIEQIKRANALIQAYCRRGKRLLFVDMFSKMLDAKKGPRPELFVEDQLHLNAQGYSIWTKALTPVLAKAMKL